MASSDLEAKAKEAFIDDHFELAVNLYSQAIALNPNKAQLFIDRAQANIKLQHFTEAVADANKAIESDPSIAKAYLRKGIACINLGEYHTAKTALEIGASLEPADSRFTSLIEECNQHLPKEAKDLLRPKYRHEFYQKLDEVVVTIFAKGVAAEEVTVEFGEQILCVKIVVPGDEETYHFQPRLFGKIIPSKCRYDVMSTKIEIRLAKADTVHWTSLEFTRDVPVVRKVNVSTANGKPCYPSSKSKRVDWDKLEAQVKNEEKDEKLDGDAGLNKFFRDIYKDADEDTRRAMMKSFVESNGTVLSTNWKEVCSNKVEGSAPDGMEFKQWEY